MLASSTEDAGNQAFEKARLEDEVRRLRMALQSAQQQNPDAVRAAAQALRDQELGRLAQRVAELERDLAQVRMLKDRAEQELNDVTDDMIGTSTHTVGVGRKPWAGSWWSQAKGLLVWGVDDTGADFDGLVTISHLAKDKFRQPAKDVQNMGEELRTIRKDEGADSQTYTDKVEEYRAAQQLLAARPPGRPQR